MDRITGTAADIILNDGEQVRQITAELLPGGAEEGMAYTITIERNGAEERRLRDEIAALRKALKD